MHNLANKIILINEMGDKKIKMNITKRQKMNI